jgi:hypothetical protein
LPESAFLVLPFLSVPLHALAFFAVYFGWEDDYEKGIPRLPTASVTGYWGLQHFRATGACCHRDPFSSFNANSVRRDG